MLGRFRKLKSGLARAARRRVLEKRCRDSRRAIGAALDKVLAGRCSQIPVFLVSYNNGIYVGNMVEQLLRYDVRPIILDNRSTDKETVSILERIGNSSRGHIVHCSKNFGHMVGFLELHYDIFPDVFAYSDPDLQFSPRMPGNFLEVLANQTSRYKVYKAGLALTVDPCRGLTTQVTRVFRSGPFPYRRDMTVPDWEARHWRFPLADDRLTLYAAPIDTTFAVYRKSNYAGDFFDAIRVGGDFEAVHLPWYPEIDPMNERQRQAYRAGNVSTTWVG